MWRLSAPRPCICARRHSTAQHTHGTAHEPMCVQGARRGRAQHAHTSRAASLHARGGMPRTVANARRSVMRRSWSRSLGKSLHRWSRCHRPVGSGQSNRTVASRRPPGHAGTSAHPPAMPRAGVKRRRASLTAALHIQPMPARRGQGASARTQNNGDRITRPSRLSAANSVGLQAQLVSTSSIYRHNEGKGRGGLGFAA
eukprot:SAG25_NODE_2_length_31535_cov_18.197322_2_plen_199_part_00